MQILRIVPKFSASCLLCSTAVPTNSFFSLCIPWFSEMSSSSLVIREYLSVWVKKLSSSTEWVIIFSVLADCGIFFPILWGVTVCSLLFSHWGFFCVPCILTSGVLDFSNTACTVKLCFIEWVKRVENSDSLLVVWNKLRLEIKNIYCIVGAICSLFEKLTARVLIPTAQDSMILKHIWCW